MIDIGADLGFYATKLVSRRRTNGTLRLARSMFPSFVAPFVRSALSLNGESDIVIQYGDKRYYVGEAAVKKSKGGRKEYSDWVSSLDWRILFCAALATATDEDATANVVVGLPLNDFARKKDRMKASIETTWSFGHMRNGPQVVTVQQATVVPQGWGAVLCRLLDEHGHIADPALVNSRQAVIDIGGHTVNYLAVDGLSDIPDESRATDRGAWTIMRHVRDFYDVEYPELNRFPDHTVMKHIVERSVWYGGEHVDLTEIVNPLIDDIACEIIDTAQAYFGQGAMTFRDVYIIGGGAHLLGPAIRSVIRHATVFENPEHANAEGFYRYACYRRRRSEIKETS